MPSVIVVGAQWGDEGKGKIIDCLTDKAAHIVRSQGGNNAGHTILIDKEEFKLHLVPSGILHPHTQCYIGAGTALDPEVLIQEIQSLEARGFALKGRLWISPAAHVIFTYHRQIDILLEKKKGARSIGTTGRGIGPCYADKANRLGIRMGELIRSDLFPKILEAVLILKSDELKMYGAEPLSYENMLNQYTRYAETLSPYVRSFEHELCQALKNDENVLFEGAQGTFLDITSGTYPFVTSSNTVAAGICAGAGIGPSHIHHTLGVVKAYTTRVGNGPLPSEFKPDEAFLDHHQAREYGTTTGRKRRIGWFDAILIKTAICLNGLQSMALTKLDILDDLAEIKICNAYRIHGKIQHKLPAVAEDFDQLEPVYEALPGWQCSTQQCARYEELPDNAKRYLHRLETLCGIPISLISVGPKRENTMILKDLFQTFGNR